MRSGTVCNKANNNCPASTYTGSGSWNAPLTHSSYTQVSGEVTSYYWGAFDKSGKSCSGGDCISNCGTFYYSDADTTTNNWVQEGLQQYYCDVAALATTGRVFAHSMGNLLIGGSCLFGLTARSGSKPKCCSLKYYNVAGPMTGTTIANLGTSVQSALSIIGISIESNADYSFLTSYQYLRNGPNSGELTQVIAENGMVLGAMCGNAYIGDGTPTSMGVECAAVKAIAGGTADCLVDWQGCANYWTGSSWANWNGGSFSNNAACRTYGANNDHLDATGNNGNFNNCIGVSIFGDCIGSTNAANPITWYNNAANYGTEAWSCN